jgi:hypothetical protein
VEWPGGVDLCPTSMHKEMLASIAKSETVTCGS